MCVPCCTCAGPFINHSFTCLLLFTVPVLQTLVGPGTPRPPHPIQPPEVAAFAAGAADGLVLVAFGSTIQTVTMAPVDLTELVRGFAALAPVRVLWALTDKGLPAGMKMQDLPLGANTRVVPWVDYNVSSDQLGGRDRVVVWLLCKERCRLVILMPASPCA